MGKGEESALARPEDSRWQFQREEIARKDEEEALTLEAIETAKSGARARTKRIARIGIRGLRKNQELNQKRKDAAQYRACRALLWERERILQETGWSLQWFTSIEKFVSDEDRRMWAETDARQVFASYRDQQLQIAGELEDLTEVFRGSKQFSALVTALRTRADVLDRIVKTGQELGVIHKASKHVEVSAKVDVTQLDVKELRVHITKQVAEIERLLLPAEGGNHPSGAVMKRLEASFSGKESESVEAEVVERKKGTRRRKVLLPDED
jgi:hypothetical protein